MSLFIERSIKEIVDDLKSGRLSSEDVCNACIESSKRYKKYNAWASYSDDIIKASYAGEYNDVISKKQNELTLCGIPVAVKDIFNTYEYPTQMGSVIWKGFQAGNDARVVYEIKRHGGIVAGKTVTAEFAVHALNETLNPYDITRTPGTSSSGSAVAVALGIVPIALATQTAGSIIRPSSFCGVFGYVPSFGLVPRTGVLKTTDSLDTIGFITSRVDNIGTFLDVISVKGPDYPFVYKVSLDKTRQVRGDRKWKACFLKTYIWDEAEDYVRDEIEGFVDELSNDEEIEIVEKDINEIISGAHEIHGTIYDKSLSYYFENEHHDSKHVSDVMNAMIEHGQKITPDRFLSALEKQDNMCIKMDEFMKEYDAIISISASSVAPKRNEIEKRDPSLIWTLLHLPSVSVPRFIEEKTGLPFGVQISGRRYNDKLLIGFVQYLEKKGLIPSKIQNML